MNYLRYNSEAYLEHLNDIGLPLFQLRQIDDDVDFVKIIVSSKKHSCFSLTW